MPRIRQLRWTEQSRVGAADPLQSALRSPVANLQSFVPALRAMRAASGPSAELAMVPPAAEVVNLPDLSDAPTPLEKACYLLKAAAEIEHALLVQYLYAGYSVDDGPLGKTLRSVAVEEMGHLATVQNLLIWLGEEPYLYRQDFGQPTDDDLRVFPFDLLLEPLSDSSLAKYVYVESPEMPYLPQPDVAIFERIEELAVGAVMGGPLNRVGLLYYLVGAVFGTKELLEQRAAEDPWYERVNSIAGHARTKYGEDSVHLRDEDLAGLLLERQASDDVWDRVDSEDSPTLSVDVKVHPITKTSPAAARDEILDALKQIGVQGEGLGPSSGGIGEFEKAHFFQFFRQFKAAFHNAGNPPNVKPVPKAAEIRVGTADPMAISHAEAADWARLGNLRYHMLIGFLELYWRSRADVRGFLAAWCFAEMYNLRKIGTFLVNLPRKDGGDVTQAAAALPFTMPPEDELQFPFDPQDGKWPQIHAIRFESAIEIETGLSGRTDLGEEKLRFLKYLLQSDQWRGNEARARTTQGSLQRSQYHQFVDILDWTVGTGDPRHAGQDAAGTNGVLGRFWNSPLDDLKKIKLFGDFVIKEGDAAGSALVRYLTQPGFQMPRGRKKLTSLEIGQQMLEDIKKWINDGANPD